MSEYQGAVTSCDAMKNMLQSDVILERKSYQMSENEK